MRKPFQEADKWQRKFFLIVVQSSGKIFLTSLMENSIIKVRQNIPCFPGPPQVSHLRKSSGFCIPLYLLKTLIHIIQIFAAWLVYVDWGGGFVVRSPRKRLFTIVSSYQCGSIIYQRGLVLWRGDIYGKFRISRRNHLQGE